MKAYRKPKRRNKLFDPDLILTRLDQALKRDFIEAQHVYCLNDSTTLYAFNRQVNELRKKYCSPATPQDDLVEKAYAKFLSINSHMAKVNVQLRQELTSTRSRISSDTPHSEKIHLRARALVRFVLGSFDEEEWFTECRNSGGSSIGVSFADTSVEKKFLYPMSVTTRAERMFERYLSYDELLSKAIENLNVGRIAPRYQTIDSSRATTVDKSNSARRFICVEPTCNMFLQQGIMHMMYKRLAKVGLDVSLLPELHQELAKVGSITGAYATIDWSSASDCVSIELLRWLLPSEWLEAILMVRCDSTILDGEIVPLSMISSMGNATTFPLETLVFWSYAVAVHITALDRDNSLFPEWEDLKSCSVFGDDCIVPSTIAHEYIRVMEEIGFIVNKEKSFYDGPMRFRESCGGDYLAGYDVRPYNIKAPRSVKMSALEPWLYTIANAFLSKYIMYFGRLSYVYDKELWRVLFSLFDQFGLEIKLVPGYYPDDAGLKLSHDIERFARHYPMKLSRIDKSDHGTYRFKYCRFQYREHSAWFDEVRFSLWLKKPTMSYRTVVHESPIRRIGGYVVAKGLSGHWSVPAVKREPNG